MIFKIEYPSKLSSNNKDIVIFVSSLSQLKNTEFLPDSDFYSLFFKEFTKKFKTVNQLPKEWIQEKKQTARILSQNIEKGNILSYQSGLSFVENELNMIIKNKIFIYWRFFK